MRSPAVPSDQEIVALSALILRSDLPREERELLARLVDRVGTALQVAPKVALLHPTCVAEVWGSVAVAYAELVARRPPDGTPRGVQT